MSRRQSYKTIALGATTPKLLIKARKVKVEVNTITQTGTGNVNIVAIDSQNISGACATSTSYREIELETEVRMLREQLMVQQKQYAELMDMLIRLTKANFAA